MGRQLRALQMQVLLLLVLGLVLLPFRQQSQAQCSEGTVGQRVGGLRVVR